MMTKFVSLFIYINYAGQEFHEDLKKVRNVHAYIIINFIIVNGILKTYYQDAIGGFVVYDITNEASLKHCKNWKEEINKAVRLRNGDPIPTVLIANKVRMD